MLSARKERRENEKDEQTEKEREGASERGDIVNVAHDGLVLSRRDVPEYRGVRSGGPS